MDIYQENTHRFKMLANIWFNSLGFYLMQIKSEDTPNQNMDLKKED